MTQALTFEEWLQGLLVAANDSLLVTGAECPPFTLDDISPAADSWKEYYEDGYSPAEAWQQDCSYA